VSKIAGAHTFRDERRPIKFECHIQTCTTADTVEWRSLGGKPFAIIQRWHIADNSDQDKDGRPIAKPMLATTRLPPGPVCHVAYIDVKANANELARKAADELARDFKCGKDEVKVIGDTGTAVGLARR
jgi:hypothetical protein